MLCCTLETTAKADDGLAVVSTFLKKTISLGKFCRYFPDIEEES